VLRNGASNFFLKTSEGELISRDLQLVFFGNLFEEGEVIEWIKLFFQRDACHWIGARPYNE